MKNNISEIAKSKEMTIATLTKKTGISRSQIYAIVNSENVPSILNARKISKALGVSLQAVFPK